MPPSEWFALPGGVLELGDTGFSVAVCSLPHPHPYLGTDPEGRPVVTGNNLQAIKEFLEQSAAWRRQFYPPQGGWVDAAALLKPNQYP